MALWTLAWRMSLGIEERALVLFVTQACPRRLRQKADQTSNIMGRGFVDEKLGRISPPMRFE